MVRPPTHSRVTDWTAEFFDTRGLVKVAGTIDGATSLSEFGGSGGVILGSRNRASLHQEHAVRPLRYSINVTFDGCCDHRAITLDRVDWKAELVSWPRSVSELAEPFEMSLPGVLQHLQVLEASGLIVSEKAGRVRTCRLQAEALDQVERWIAARRTRWERRLDRLGHHRDARENDPSEADRGDDP